MAHIQELPDEVGDHDCPICYEPNTLQDRVPVCRNGHRMCADCQPRIQSVRTGFGFHGAAGHAVCPLCRAPIPYIPLPPHRDALPALLLNGQPDPFHAPPPIVGHPLNNPNPHVPAADGRANDPDRPQRAIDGFNNLPERRRAQARFRQARNDGTIPQNAMFGGIHTRGCGGCPQNRKHGHGGVRFFKMPDGKRKYRCEACYIAAYGDGVLPPPPPEWSMNGVAAAAHNDQDV